MEANTRSFGLGYVLGALTMLLVGGAIILGTLYWKGEQITVLEVDDATADQQELELKEYAKSLKSDLYLDKEIEDCPDSLTVSDQYACLHALVITMETEARELENSLISLAQRGIDDTSSERMSWEPGGEIFLSMLPERVNAARSSVQGYIQSYCDLDQMKLQGGSGMDLEREACRMFLIKNYIELLRSLEHEAGL